MTKYKTNNSFELIACVFFIILIVVFLVIGLFINLHSENGEFKVIGKEVINTKSSYSYLIYTDKTTLKITDSYINWRFDSSDVYGKIEIGKTYKAKLQGYRFPFFSMYQNIIEPVEINK